MSFLTAPALTKQKALLEKGKSRLIDSYASSIIDKDEFAPKIKSLKIKLAQYANDLCMDKS